MTTDDQAPSPACKHKHSFSYATILLLCLLSTACGGGGSGTDTPSGGDANPVDNGSSENPAEEQGGTADPSCQMTATEVEMLAQVNAARSQARNCGSTAYSSVAALGWDCKLAQAAAGHSGDMAQNNFFSHTGSNGLGPGFRIEVQGYEARTWGENIAAGYSDIDSAVNGWLSSPGHCGNIMHSDFTEFGMASAQDPGSDFGVYWTQVFAAPATASAQSSALYRNYPQGRLGGDNLYRYPATE